MFGSAVLRRLAAVATLCVAMTAFAVPAGQADHRQATPAHAPRSIIREPLSAARVAHAHNSAPSAPKTLGVRRVLVILVTFKENGQLLVPDTDPAGAGQMLQRVGAFYAEQSYGKFTYTGESTPWLTIPFPGPTPCSTLKLTQGAEAAARQAGYHPDAYDNVLIHFPKTSGACFQWNGLADIPGRYSWSNGLWLPQIIAHELGHSLGLFHAHFLRCTHDGVEVSLSDTCSVEEYGDSFDMMGTSPSYEDPPGSGQYVDLGHTSAYQKHKLGWLTDDRIAIPSDGTSQVTIAPLEFDSGGAPMALRVPTEKKQYWIEYRVPYGDDGGMGADQVNHGDMQGLMIRVENHEQQVSNEDGPAILNLHPGNGLQVIYQSEMLLHVGETYADPWNAFSITVDSIDQDGAHATVSYSTDQTAPNAATILKPLASQAYRTHSPTFSWLRPADSGSGVDRYSVTVDGTTTLPASATHLTTPSLGNGPHTFTVTSIDRAGNQTISPSRRFVIDTIPPDKPRITGIANLAGGRPQIRYARPHDSISGVASVTLRIDGRWYAATTNPSQTSLRPRTPIHGRHTFTIVVQDGAGNSSIAAHAATASAA